MVERDLHLGMMGGDITVPHPVMEIPLHVEVGELRAFISNPDARLHVGGRQLAPDIGSVAVSRRGIMPRQHATLNADVIDRFEVARVSIVFPGILRCALQGPAAKGVASVTVDKARKGHF